MVSQRIEQCPVLVAMGGMDEHAGGFVYDDEVRVFVDDVERYVLGLHGCTAGQVGLDLDKIARTQAVTRILKFPVHRALAGLDQLTQVHLAQAVEIVKQIFAQLLLVGLGPNLEMQLCRLFVIHSNAEARTSVRAFSKFSNYQSTTLYRGWF